MALPRRSEDHQPDHQPDASGADWRTLYEIENPADVEAYVSQHPSASAVLAEAPTKIREILGEIPYLRLRVSGDPEWGDDWLFVAIPIEYVPGQVDPIQVLGERWWLDAMPRTDATIVFDLAHW